VTVCVTVSSIYDFLDSIGHYHHGTAQRGAQIGRDGTHDKAASAPGFIVRR
jgi:hypothetical protein